MKKRAIGLFLALCMAVALLPMTVFAEETPAGDGQTAAKPSIVFAYSAPDSAPDEEQTVEGSETPTIIPGKADVLVEMKAGDAAKYWITGEHDATAYAGKYYLKDGTEENWNVKLEYPADGIPTVTLKNARIENVYRGIALLGSVEAGGAQITHTKSTAFAGDVKVILEGENQINHCNELSPLVYFHINGTASITGAGSLKITHSTHSKEYGIIHANGNLLFDNTNIHISVPSKAIVADGKTTSYYGNGIVALYGDLTVKGGNLFFDGHNLYPSGNGSIAYSKYRPIAYALWATKDAEGKGGNLNIQDKATVQVYASTCNGKIPYYKWTKDYGDGITATYNPQVRGMVRVENAINIANSNVTLAIASGHSSSSGGFLEVKNSSLEQSNIGVKLNLEFEEGYTLVYGSSRVKYDTTTNTFVEPTSGTVTFKNEIPEFLLQDPTPYYFKVTSGYEKDPETGADTGADTGTDAGTDTGADTGTDTGSTNGNPQTGDVSILLTAGIALASAVSFGGVTVLRRKSN